MEKYGRGDTIGFDLYDGYGYQGEGFIIDECSIGSYLYEEEFRVISYNTDDILKFKPTSIVLVEKAWEALLSSAERRKRVQKRIKENTATRKVLFEKTYDWDPF